MTQLLSGPWTLAQVATVMGVLLFLLSVPAVVAPEGAMKMLLRFPRHKVTGWVLSALALAWAALVLYHMPLGRLGFLKSYLVFLGPVAFILVVFFLDELLAPRALGGLFLLAGAPLLDAARWHDSSWRYAVTILVYIGVCLGMVLVLSPYRFRYLVQRCAGTAGRCRTWGAAGAVVGLLLLLLGFRVY